MTNLVRNLEPTDITKINRIDEQTQKQYLGNLWGKLTRTQQDQKLITKNYNYFDAKNINYSFVAVKEKEIIGFILATRTSSKSVLIKHIALDPRKQNKGYGQLLIKNAISRAVKDGISKVSSHINTDNPRSINLHKKLGFRLKKIEKNKLEAILNLMDKSADQSQDPQG